MDQIDVDRGHYVHAAVGAPPDVLIGLLSSPNRPPSQMPRLVGAWSGRLPQAAFATLGETANPEHLRSCVADLLSRAGLPPERLLLVGIGASARQALALAFTERGSLCRGILAYGACPVPDVPDDCDGTGMQLRLIEGHEDRHIAGDILGKIVHALQARRFDVRAAILAGSAARVTHDALRLGGTYIADMVATTLACSARMNERHR
jgi:predicted esterase